MWVHNARTQIQKIVLYSKTGFKRSCIQNKSDSDFVWQIRLIRIKVWKFPTHTDFVNLKMMIFKIPFCVLDIFSSKKFLFIEGLGCLTDLGWVSGKWPRIQDDSSPHHSVQQRRLQSFGLGDASRNFLAPPCQFLAPQIVQGGANHESTNK